MAMEEGGNPLPEKFDALTVKLPFSIRGREDITLALEMDGSRSFEFGRDTTWISLYDNTGPGADCPGFQKVAIAVNEDSGYVDEMTLAIVRAFASMLAYAAAHGEVIPPPYGIRSPLLLEAFQTRDGTVPLRGSFAGMRIVDEDNFPTYDVMLPAVFKRKGGGGEDK